MKYMPTIRSGRPASRQLLARFDEFFSKFERAYFDQQRELAEDENEVLSSFVPDVEVEESEYEFLITADIPDLLSDDVRIDLSADVLQIHDTHGKFLRSFSIPDNIDTNHIEAHFKDGVLKVRLPKLDLTEPHNIQIN